MDGWQPAPSQDAPHAFLSSRLVGLEDVRYRIWRQSQQAGTPIWASEITAGEELKNKTLDAIQVACLKQVRMAPKFICLLDGSFGTTWNEGQVSILELELATAAFSKRDIWILLLAPFDKPDPRLLSLLQAIRVSCPQARIKDSVTPRELYGAIASILDPVPRGKETVDVAYLVQRIARTRAPALNFNLNLRDVQFLNREFVPLLDRPPDETFIRRLVGEAASEQVIPDKLAKLWVAVRHLCAAPFSNPHYEKFLPLWEQALSHWSSASAWYSLHGHFYLGRLAAVNTLCVLRSQMPRSMQVEVGPRSIFANNGAAASEYYSMAKLVPSRRVRYSLLSKALWNCNVALHDASASDPSGLLDIRGHIKLAMLNPVGGIADLKRALAIRRNAGEGPGRIGESEVHLGRAYAVCRLHRKAEQLLEEGVAKLAGTDRYPFIIQGLRHLGAFYRHVGRRVDAITVLRRAQMFAAEREVQGQLEQIEKELRELGET